MINKLDNDLNYLQHRQNQHMKLLNQLYLSLQEIDHRKQSFNKIIPNRNLFEVRPEVMYQILVFIDLKAYMRFRLVSRRCNLIIKQTLNQKVKTIFQEIQFLEKSLDKVNDELDSIKDQEIVQNQQLQQAKQTLQDQLHQAQLNEFRSYARPPSQCYKTCMYLANLMLPDLEDDQDTWKAIKKLLGQSDFISQLVSLKISEISEKQLAKLSSINEMNERQVAIVSQAAGCIFGYIQAVFSARQSNWYLKKDQENKIKIKIQNKKSLISHLEKIASK